MERDLNAAAIEPREAAGRDRPASATRADRSRLMRAVWNGVTIAQSDDTVVVEGNHYFPLDSVDPSVLHASRMKSLCPWKGLASYYDVELDGARNPNAAWTYRHPYPWIRKIKDRVAFWNGVQVVRD